MSPVKPTEEADFLLGQSNKLFLLFRAVYKKERWHKTRTEVSLTTF